MTEQYLYPVMRPTPGTLFQIETARVSTHQKKKPLKP